MKQGTGHLQEREARVRPGGDWRGRAVSAPVASVSTSLLTAAHTAPLTPAPLTPAPLTGLFSTIMRDLANITHDGPKWIVLDGDIDPMWIESLNTVMDDNKVGRDLGFTTDPQNHSNGGTWAVPPHNLPHTADRMRHRLGLGRGLSGAPHRKL